MTYKRFTSTPELLAPILRPRKTLDGCYDRGIPFFGEKIFLSPKSSETGHFVFHDSRRVPRPWEFSSGIIAVLIFSESVFALEKVLSSQIDKPQKEKVARASVVARVIVAVA